MTTNWNAPAYWNWLHNLAISYNNNSLENARTTFRRIWNFANNLPCNICKNHAKEYILNTPPDLRSNEALQRWVWTFHNTVNIRLNKRVMSYANYKKLYRIK